MKRRCADCVIYGELQAPEKLITKDEMMSRLSAVPSQEGIEKKSAMHADLNKSLRSFHPTRGSQ